MTSQFLALTPSKFPPDFPHTNTLVYTHTKHALAPPNKQIHTQTQAHTHAHAHTRGPSHYTQLPSWSAIVAPHSRSPSTAFTSPRIRSSIIRPASKSSPPTSTGPTPPSVYPHPSGQAPSPAHHLPRALATESTPKQAGSPPARSPSLPHLASTLSTKPRYTRLLRNRVPYSGL